MGYDDYMYQIKSTRNALPQIHTHILIFNTLKRATATVNTTFNWVEAAVE